MNIKNDHINKVYIVISFDNQTLIVDSLEVSVKSVSFDALYCYHYIISENNTVPTIYSYKTNYQINLQMREMKTTKLLFLVIFVFAGTYTYAQNSMGVGTQTPNPNAVLELVSPTNNQGFLVPRLTTAERTDIAFTGNLSAADNGLMVFDTDEGQFYFWMGTAWQVIANDMVLNDDDSLNEIQDLELVGNILRVTNNSSATDIDLTPYLDNTDNQDAASVPFTPAGNIAAGDVQAALEELDTDISSLGTGNMSTSVYDTNSDGIADSATYALNAGTVNSLTVETAVPAGADFTDDQQALDVPVVPSGNITSTDVQSALTELDARVETPVPAGAVFTDNQAAIDVAYDNASSGISATSVQAAIDTLQNNIVSAGGGDMLRSVYDSDFNNKVQVAEAADSLSDNFIDGVTLAYNNVSQQLEVPDNGIGSAKIADGSVILGKIGTGAVTTTNLEDGAILSSKLGIAGASEGNVMTFTGGIWQGTTPSASDLGTVLGSGSDAGGQVITNVGSIGAGVGAEAPLSTVQVDSTGHIFTIGGDLAITDNVHEVGGVPKLTTADAGLILSISSDGGFEVIYSPSGPAGSDATFNQIFSVNTSGVASIPGQVITDIVSSNGILLTGSYTGPDTQGTLRYNNAGYFEGYDGTGWQQLADVNDLSAIPWANITSIPADIADGDQDTQLNEAAVDAFVGNNGYLTAEVDGSTTNEIQNLTQVLTTGNDAGANNITNVANLSVNGIVNATTFAGSLDWANIANVPADIADGDQDTQLNEAAVDGFVANNGYLLPADIAGYDSNAADDLITSSLRSDVKVLGPNDFFLLEPATGTVTNSFNSQYPFKRIQAEAPSARLAAELDLPENSTVQQIIVFGNAGTNTGSFNVVAFPFGSVETLLPQGSPTAIPVGAPTQNVREEAVVIDKDGDILANEGNKFYLILQTAAEAGTTVDVYQVKIIYEYPIGN